MSDWMLHEDIAMRDSEIARLKFCMETARIALRSAKDHLEDSRAQGSFLHSRIVTALFSLDTEGKP